MRNKYTQIGRLSPLKSNEIYGKIELFEMYL